MADGKVFVYHRVPDNMFGNLLYPLNTLKQIKPEIYEEEVEKYKGREYLLSESIPVLNCLWNDVLHLSPVSPDKVVDAYSKLGQSIHLKSFKIDASMLEPEKTIIYLHQYPHGDKFKPDNWETFSLEKVQELTQLPQRTVDYYAGQFKEGNRPLIYGFVPHVLCMGSIDITNCEVVEA